MAQINTKIRFNEESKAIEVVLQNTESGSEQVLGSVTADEYAEWPLTEVAEPFDTTELDSQIATLTAERDDWKNKFDSLVAALANKTPAPVEEIVAPPADAVTE